MEIAHKSQKHKINPKVVLQITFPLILFTIITLQLSKNVSLKRPLQPSDPIIISYIEQHAEVGAIQYANPPTQEQVTPTTPLTQDQQVRPTRSTKCDLFSGEWVLNPEAPYYTNTSCRVIQEHQNCMKFGRPDSEFLKWRWKPNGCELPIFNPNQFLDIVKGKSLAFVGDSVARNQMQSLICLLSRVEHPIDVSNTTDDNFKRWYYQSYNFTLAIYWSPFLVKNQDNDPNGKKGKSFMGLFLDEANEAWTAHIDDLDYVIISAGHWFFRPLIYYEKNHFMGCRYCEIGNLTEYSLSYGYRNAFRTAFRAILERKTFKGKVFLRTFAPSHFEGGEWDHGGNCLRKKPYKSTEVGLEGENLEVYTSQMEEFGVAQKLGQQRGLSFQLMDMTRLMLMRPDGHPSTYGRPANLNVTWPSDCIHWCLPGPIDSWNDFLLEMLRAEGVKPKE